MISENDQQDFEIVYDNNDDSDLSVLKLQNYFLPVLYSITCISGVFGNLLVIIIYSFYEKMKTLTDILIVNLAVADMLFLCTLPFLAYHAANTWIFGEVMCKLIRGVYRINLYTSMLTLTCITLDRYISITQAIKASRYQSNKYRWGKFICAIAWAFSVLLAVPQFKYSQSTHGCFEKYHEPYLELLVNSLQIVIGFLLPLIAIIFCYTLIVKTLIITSNFQKQKSFKIIFTVVLVFVTTQLPYNTVIFISVLENNLHTNIHVKIAMIVTEAIAYLHACLNPVLYFFVGIKFRKNFWKILNHWGLVKQQMEHLDNIRTIERDSKNMSASTNIEAISMH
ncbi:hypothetical protein GDO86_011475 [Hymenochirus boettgeri]|uniref:C-X-C chemokine receptor type 6 n=1 Tax=Hymenochirus boettgeri TaxID=247094 RepID=A0A8T2JGR2_9PIPI|nr:hypothetical protein GDO86_011475 [Hymenochirus boettgeri]